MGENIRMILVGIIGSMIFVAIGCAWLSLSAEALDEIAEHFGANEFHIWIPPMPDYEIPGLEGNIVANIAVGAIFVLVVLVVTFAVGKCLKPSEKKA
jgi:hypothetical protein